MTFEKLLQRYRLLVIACCFICSFNSFKLALRINIPKKSYKSALDALSDGKEVPAVSPLVAIYR